MNSRPVVPDEARSRLVRLQSYLGQDPDNLDLLADVADLALGLGEIDLARNSVIRALELRPGDAFFSLRLSSVAIAEGNFDDALAITTALMNRGEHHPAIRYNHAFALVSAARFAEARPILAELHAEKAEYPLIGPLLIRCHHYLADLDQAIALAQDLLITRPDDAQIVGMLSLLYFDRNDFAHAGAWAEKALALDPANLDALLAAGGSALANENAASATDFSHRAISAKPRNGRAWANLGMAELLKLNLTGAREALENATKYMPGHIGTWVALGWTQLLQNDLDAAEASFQAALAIDDNFGETHGGLAAVAAMRENWAQAEQSATIARRLAPDSMAHHYVKIVKQIREGQPELALRLMDRALSSQQAPAGGSLRDMLIRLTAGRR